MGYIPAGMSLDAAAEMREDDPHGYEERVLDSMVTHVEAMLALQSRPKRWVSIDHLLESPN